MKSTRDCDQGCHSKLASGRDAMNRPVTRKKADRSMRTPARPDFCERKEVQAGPEPSGSCCKSAMKAPKKNCMPKKGSLEAARNQVRPSAIIIRYLV